MVRFRVGLATISLCLAGCVSTPPLSGATGQSNSGVLISEVVQRVKCELSDAFFPKVHEPGFTWLKDWTAHVDLTLSVSSSAGIAPGVSSTRFFNSAVNFDATPTSYPVTAANSASRSVVQQTFVVGAGANLSGQAIRTEILSFTLSLDEIERWRRTEAKSAKQCEESSRIGLLGNLGLKEWVDSAFYPAEIGQLRAGIHPTGQSSKAGVSSPGSANKGQKAADHATPPTFTEANENLKAWASLADELANELAPGKEVLKTAISDVRKASADIDAKLRDAAKFGPTLEPYLRRRYREAKEFSITYAKDVGTCVKVSNDIDMRLSKVRSEIATLIKATANMNPADFPARFDFPSYYNSESAIGDLTDGAIFKIPSPGLKNNKYVQAMTECSQMVAAAIALPTLLPSQVDPPIDSISHSLQFVINYGANVSPTWSMLEWKGPAPGGNLFSASGVRTHNMVIAMGPRSGGPQVGTDALRLINLQAIKSLSGL